MTKNLKKLLFIIIVYNISINATKTGPFLSTRSQSTNAARHSVGWNQRLNVNNQEDIYNNISVTPSFTRSFNANDITKFFFGNDVINKDSIKLSGSYVTTRNETDWLADYFGLPTDFESIVEFTPRIINCILDFNWKKNFNIFKRNFYLDIKAPLCYTNYNMNLKETVKNRGINSFKNGYMDSLTLSTQTLTTIGRSILPVSFERAVQGETTFGDMQHSLRYGKIDGKRSKTRLSDVHINFGYNFLEKEYYHVAGHLHFGLPLGNKPNAEFLFEPIVGNGAHVEFGANINAHKVLWNSLDEERAFSIYADININHLFKTKQKRSFDLKNKPNSRYMLIAELGAPTDGLLFYNTDPTTQINTATDGAVSTVQYQSELFPLINKSTLDSHIHINLQADIAIKCQYIHNKFAFDFGYNLWARTKEQISLDKKFKDGVYVLKGDSHMYGFAEAAEATAPAMLEHQAVALAPSQSQATINSGRNRPPKSSLINQSPNGFNAAGNDITQNPGIDRRRFARTAAADTNNRQLLSVPITNLANSQTSTSTQPIYISNSDLDTSDNAVITHKIFAHLSYTCKERKTFIPFFGAGFEGEFDGRVSKNKRVTLSQWGVWSKVGISFN